MESLEFNARYGNVCYDAPGLPTFETVANLAKAAALIGIPASAHVTSLRLDPRGETTRVEIGWQV